MGCMSGWFIRTTAKIVGRKVRGVAFSEIPRWMAGCKSGLAVKTQGVNALGVTRCLAERGYGNTGRHGGIGDGEGGVAHGLDLFGDSPDGQRASSGDGDRRRPVVLHHACRQ